MKVFFLYLMAAIYIAAGVNHFWHPAMYLRIMPPWLPWPQPLVLLSGVLEILFGAMLFLSQTRTVGAWGLMLLLIAVFPANVQTALNYDREANPHLWLSIARLPLQPLLIWWAWQYTK